VTAARVEPVVFPTVLDGDTEPGGVAQVILTCNSYHRPPHVGKTFTYTNQPYNCTIATRVSINNTSYNVANVVKPILQSL
jgi:hypothetical protein